MIDGPTYLGGVDQFEEKAKDAHMIQSIVFRVSIGYLDLFRNHVIRFNTNYPTRICY